MLKNPNHYPPTKVAELTAKKKLGMCVVRNSNPCLNFGRVES